MRIRSVKHPSTLELSEDSVLIDRHEDAWQPKRRDQKEHTWVKTERDPEPPAVVVEDEEHLVEEYGPLDLAWPRLFGPTNLRWPPKPYNKTLAELTWNKKLTPKGWLAAFFMPSKMLRGQLISLR